MTYEYKIVTLPKTKIDDYQKIENALNEHTKWGWKLHTITIVLGDVALVFEMAIAL